MQIEPYQKVLIALDVFVNYEPILARGLQMAGNVANVSIVHVLLPEIAFAPYGVTYPTDMVNHAREEANEKLKHISKEYDVSPDEIFISVGKPADEIQKLSEKIGADLIVIGTHGRSGISLLLGSTANGVLHGVKRDVLAVKI